MQIETPAELLRECGDKFRVQGQVLRHASEKDVWTPEWGTRTHWCSAGMIRHIAELAGWNRQRDGFAKLLKVERSMNLAISQRYPGKFVGRHHEASFDLVIRWNDGLVKDLGELCAMFEKAAAIADEIVD